MSKKRAKGKTPYLLSNFDRKLLIRIRLYAFNKDIYIWQAFEELCTKGLLYDAEHELRTMQDKTLAKSTNFFARVLGLAGKKKESGLKRDEHP